MFEKLPISLSSLVLLLGVASTGWGFYVYNDPIWNLVGIFTGIPLLLGGLVMKAVELKPVPPMQPSSEAVLKLREQQATEIQNQIRFDITKYSYGASAHMERALEFLGLKGGIDADLPKLLGYQEESREGRYTLLLRFKTPAVSFERWQESYDKKMGGFFGRDVQVILTQVDEVIVELVLISQKQA